MTRFKKRHASLHRALITFFQTGKQTYLHGIVKRR